MEQRIPFSEMRECVNAKRRSVKIAIAALLLSLAGITTAQAQCEFDAADFTLSVEQSLVNNTQLKCTYNGSNTNWISRWSLYVTNLATGETQSYEDFSDPTKTITNIGEGEYSWYIRAVCDHDTSNIINGENFTVTCQHYPTYANFQFQRATDSYVLYCNQTSSNGYSLTNTNQLSNNLSSLGLGTATVTYSIDREDIATYNSQTGNLDFTGVSGTVVVTATGSVPGYCDTTASFTLTVIKPELSFNTITITPTCYVLEDENYGMDGNIDISFNCQCTNNNLYRYTISPAPNSQIASSGQASGSSSGGNLNFYGVHPDTYTITIYIEGSDISIDTTVVVPMKLQISVQNDSSTVCAENPNLTLIANVTAALGQSLSSLTYSWMDEDSNVISTNQWCNITTGHTNPVLTVTESVNNCRNTYTPTINWIDNFGEITVNSIDITPSCGGDNGTVQVNATSECGSPDFQYVLTPGSGTNNDGYFVDLAAGQYTITVTEATTGFQFDTTVTVPEQTTCDITATGTPSLTILDYSYEDYENSGNFGEFYYRLEIPSVDGTPESIEVQYGLVGSDSPSSVYYNPSTGAGSIKIPITAKGDWEVKMRARCCGGSFPGNTPGDWFLIDTIHHYPNFAISTEGYCYRIPPAQSENGSVSMTFNPPHNVSSNSSEMRVRIFPVDNSSDIKYDGSGTSGAIELADLSEGDYKVYVYINDGTDENTFNAYLDTTFTIGNRFKITLQNDSSTFCATDSVLYRAIVTGGRAPYEYEWVAYETTFGIGDDSIWVNFDIASSDDPGVTVTDADGCFSSTEIHVNLLPAYTQATDYYYDSYTYSRNRYIIASQLPFTLQDFTFDGSETSASHEFTFQTAKGCDSIVHIDFSQKPGIALPSSGNLDTTITTGVDVYDDGGFSSAAALHADRTLTLHAPEGNTLELQLTGRTFDLGEGEALYVYDYNGVNDNALLFEYRQGMNTPNMDFTSNSRSLTFRYVTGNSCAQGFIMTVNTKDISNECLPVYNVTSTLEMAADTWVRCNMQWEYSGVADSFEVKYVGLKWNDAEAKLDTINGPVTEYTTSNSIQIGCYNNLGIENCQIAVRAICGVGDTSEACLHSFIPFSPLIIPHTGDTLVVLDSTIRAVFLYDEGGVDGSYTDEADGSLTVKAADGYELVIAQSSTYDLEDNYDFLYITDDYDGSATNTYLLDTLNGEGGTLESDMYSRSDGFKFTLKSDESQTKGGLSFIISQVKLDECLPSYNPKAEKFSNPADGVYYHITDAGPYGANVGDRVQVKKTNVATNAITYDTLALEMGDNNRPILSIEPQYTMDVQLATLCGYSTTPVWSEPVRLSACVAPVGLSAVSPATTNSIDIQLDTYTEADRYLVSYHIAGSNSWYDTVVTSSTFTLQNLAPSSNYEVRAASICSDGDTSDFSNSITMSTDCGYRPGLAEDEIYREPDAFRFDMVEVGNELSNMPSCWSRGDYEYNLRHYPYIAKDTSINADGDYSLLFWAQAPSSDEQIAILPQFDTYYGTMDKWALSFTANLRNLDIAECRTPDSAQLEIGVMTNPLDESTFTLVETIHVYNTIVDANYVVPLRNYNGSGLYPAIKMQGNQVSYDYTPYVLLKDFMVIPDLHIEAPTNLQVVPHPVQNDKALVTWDCSEMDDFPDDGFEQFKVAVNQQTYDSYEKSVVINTTPGVTYTIRVTHSKPSGRYGRTMAQTGFTTVQYTAPLYDHMQVDTIMASNGETTIEGTEPGMPFSYGEQSSSEAIYNSSEVTATTINAIAIRRKPGCNTTGSFQRITIRMADVDNESFNVQDNGNGTYTILNGHEFYTEQEQLTTNYTPNGDGWIVFELDQPYTHDPSKNLLVGFDTYPGDYADQWGGEVEFYHDHGDPSAKGLSLKTQDLSSLSSDYTYNPICRRPQMLFIQNKNCTNDSLIIDTTLCESATLTWRGDTISFSDDDIELHKVAIDSTYNYDRYEWEYTYAYIYNDKIEGVGTGGCDSIYQLRIEKRYNVTNNYDMEDVDYPHEVSCGPFTWRNGETYDYSMGTYVYYEYDDASPSFGYYGPRAMDTVRGVTADGCDSIYGLNLEITPYFTVIFDTSNVDAGSAMAPQYICDADSYAVPSCTMSRNHYDFGGWLYDGDTLFRNDPIEAETGDTILLTPLWEVNCGDGFIADEDYQDFCVLNSSYTWRGHTITLDYLKAHGYYNEVWLTGEENDDIPYIYVDDTLSLAVDGVCDSIYRLKVRMEDRMELTDYYSDDSYWDVCSLGFTWSDGNHYTADTGWYWWSDPDDNDNYAYATLDISSAPMWIDSTANSGCGTLHVLGMAVDDTLPGITVYYVKYYEENATHLDTLWSMTTSVCEGVDYTIPDMPDTVTREGYDFVQWTDNPACGWTVEPGVAKRISTDGDYYVFYGMWESNCSDVTKYDTIFHCYGTSVNRWPWYTLDDIDNYVQGTVLDTSYTSIGAVPGECDSIYYLHFTQKYTTSITQDTSISTSCYGSSDGSFTFTISGNNAPYQYSGSVSGTAYSDTTITVTGRSAGTHTIEVMDACGESLSRSMTVNQPEQITVSVTSYSSEGVCYSTDMVKQLNASATGGNGYYNYKWNNDATRTYDTLMVSLNVPGTFHDTVIVTDSNGCTGTGTYTYTVYDTLKVTINGGDTSYCKNAPSVPLTVTVTGGDTNGYTYQWSNYSPIDTATGPSFTVPTSGGSTVLYDNISVTVTNACGEKTAQGPVITVLDSLRLVAYTNDATLCFGASTAQMEVDVQGGGAFTGQWYMNGTAVTDHNPGDADNKYTPRTDTAGTFNYSLKVTSNAGCGSDSVQVKNLTVYDTLVVTSLSSDTTICVWSSDTLRVSVAGGSGSYTYQWKKDGSDIADATQEFYRVWAEDADTSVYSVHVTDANGCGDTTITIATVTIPEYITLTTSMVDTTYCYGAQAAPITLNPTGGDGTYTYQWIVANNDDMMGSETLSTTGNSHTPTTDSAASYYYRVIITSGVCSTERDVARIYVMDQVRINLTPDTSTICFGSEGTTYELTDHTEGGYDPYTYKWFKDGTYLDGEDGDSYMPVGSTAGTFTYSAIATDEAGCHSDTTTVGVLTVKANMAVTSTLQDTSYCYNSTADTMRVTVTGGSGTYNYRWFVHDFYENVLSTEAAYKPATDQAGTTLYDIEVTDNECGTDTSFTVASITVNYRFQVAIDDADQSNTYCLNTTPLELTLEDAILGSGNYSYQWYAYDVDEDVTDTLTGATSITYTPTTNNAGNTVYKVKVTDQICGGDTTTSVANISVRDALTVTKSGDTALCANGTTTLSVTPEGGWGNYTYQWQKQTDGGMGVIQGEETNSYTTEQLAPGTYYYRAVVQDQCDTAFIVFTVNVSSNPDVTSNIDTTYCFGATAEAITLNPTGGNGEYSYLWVVANHDDMMPADTLDVTTNSYVPVTDSAAEYYYRVTITSGGCSSELDVARINVIEQVKINVEPDTSSICYGAEGTTYELDDYTAGGYGQYTYQWYMNGGEVFDETSSTYMPIGDAAGTFVYSAVAFDNSGCQSDTATVGVLTVKAKMAVTSRLQDTTYCYGATADTMRVTVTGGSGNYTYEWMTNGDIVSTDTFFVPNTTEIGMTEIMLNVYDDECMTDTSITVGSSLVYDTLALSMADTTALSTCTSAVNWDRELIVNYNQTSDLEPTFQWYRNNDTLVGETSATYTITSPIDTTGSFIYTVHVGDQYGCTDTTLHAVRLTGYPDIQWERPDSLSQEQNWCINVNPEQLVVIPSGGTGQYSYKWYKYVDGESVTLSTDTNFYTPTIDSVSSDTILFSLTSVGTDHCGRSTGTAYYVYVHDVSTGVDTMTACDSYMWIDSVTYTMSTSDMDNVPTYTLQNQYGCDSTRTLNLTINESISAISDSLTAEGCFEGNEEQLAVEVSGGDTNNTYQWYRNGEVLADGTEAEYLFNYDTVGAFNFSVKVTAGNGCGSDSVHVASITVYDTLSVPAAATDSVYYCAGNTMPVLTSGITGGSGRHLYQWFLDGELIDNATGNTYQPVNTPGDYTYSLRVFDSAGCGDVTQYFAPIHIYSIDSATVPVTACDSYTWMVNNQTYDSSTVANATLTDQHGCDSIVTLNLTINYSNSGNDTVTTCEIYTWNNTDYDTSGTYTKMLFNQYGCDSTATLYLTINNGSSRTDTMTACDNYTWIDSVTYTSSTMANMPSLTLTDQNGCDSVVYLNLTINYSSAITYDTISACDSYTWIDSVTYTISTTEMADAVTHTLQNQYGCDSTVTLQLTINRSIHDTLTQTACDSYTWQQNMATYDSTGVYTMAVEQESGCPAQYVLNLTINNGSHNVFTDTACNTYTWERDSLTYGVSGTYTYSYTNDSGCTSVDTLYLTIADNHIAYFITGDDSLQNVNTIMDSIVVCSIEPYLVLPENEYVYDMHTFIGWQNTATGDTVQPGDTVVLTDNTTFNTVWRANCQNVDTVEYAEYCEGGSTTWRGMTISGLQQEYTDTVAGVVDVLCDSVYHLLVTVHYPTTSDTTMLACDSVWWNGMFFTETPDTTQSYFMAGGNQYGCDSTAYLNLTVNYSIHDYVVETACDSYTFDNVTYTESTDLPTVGAI
nr:fibronectin type III domain-containing protein [Bacteroidales bacterium]